MFGMIKRLFGGAKGQPDYKALRERGALILDVRSPGEFAGGHIEGSINIPVDQLRGNLKKLKDKDQSIICCCASGMRSGSAASILSSHGYKSVFNGGGWMKLNRKLQ